ncbi:MAG TPA: ATP-grasp domain-containing protein [Terriglobales bacterium]|nr:ATP-grasp domain-containing protein [Terriglobales bacterium]
MKPKVLVATTSRWVPTARLVMALAHAGCAVHAVCPPGHPLGKTNAVSHTHNYHGLAPLKSFRNAIVATNPDLIVPGDDLATRHLHDLHRWGQHEGNRGSQISALIERSLGAPESFPVVFARNAFMEAARHEDVRVPQTGVIENQEDLRKLAGSLGFPLVLKANGTSGGDGVRIAQTLEEAERALRTLQAPPLFARAAKRALVDQDATLLWPSMLRRRYVVNAQAFVMGREATSAVFCWKGSVVAALHFEVVNKMHAAGHAAVLRLIEHPEMSIAAEKMARRLNLSGFYGFDFMLEADTENAYLIEVNPRTTQVGHLALGAGRDLPASLYATISGDCACPNQKVTEKDIIALFPQEWMRDPASEFLQSGYHDVPWEQPALVSDCIRKSQTQRAWYAKPAVSAVRSSSMPLTVRPKHRAVEVDCEAK